MSKKSHFRQKQSDILRTYIQKPLVRPDEFSDNGVKPLSGEEQQTVNQLWDILALAFDERQFTIVFRGEKKEKLRAKLFDAQDYFQLGKMFTRLFYFGEKAKYYFEQNKNTLGENDYLKYINDISNETFEFVFKKIHLIVSLSAENLTQKKQIVVKKFLDNEGHHEFVTFFQSRENSPCFIRQIEQIADPQERERVRDYYLYLLHTFGRSSIGNMSFFVSTSTNQKTAEYFATGGGRKRRQSVIFLYFIPKPLHKHGISHFTALEFHKRYQHTGLPLYNRTFYPRQEEVAIKGALFPHYILGLYDLEHNHFVLNPYIFEQSELALKYVPISGLQIDQTLFDDLIKDTGYTGYVQRQWNGIYSDKFHR
ncbi:MAG: hypothetical protein KF753_21620 [Caldilineaceae bacterium]|nr:hypothetical protein [Caldilineaceae bacterium]